MLDFNRKRSRGTESFNYSGTLIDAKGKITQEAGETIFYVFISSKRFTLGDSE